MCLGENSSSRPRYASNRRGVTLVSRSRVVVAAVTLLALCDTRAYAQNSRWADPYRNGVKAFDSGKYAEAIPLLERAVAADPKSQQQKRIEGVFTIDYFPYY